ncbi:MAG: MBL fold metallo-hydrolase [Ornithinimicrobium sp.]|uniref:MBL fold metallo-hydrolase n=1 Tax=Ornithinimicrobium sp. TaxID=1977084 RepID=UPI003D9B4E30
MTIILTRRLLLRSGVGGLALGVVTITAGCNSDKPSPGSGSGSGSPEATGAETAGQDGTDAGDQTSATATAGPASWSRVDLGFVSAYVLVRAGQAVVVDTGTKGSESAIEGVLTSLGVGWADVGHVVLTHQHGDHVGSAPAVAQAAPDATFHAGAADVPAIDIGRQVSPVADGDRVAELTIVATPGHTPGHVSVHDTANGVLVAGDALISTDGRLALPDPDFASDYGEALRSVALLGDLEFAAAYVGHGQPVLRGAADQVRALG